MFKFIKTIFGETRRQELVSKSSTHEPAAVEKSPPVPNSGISSWSPAPAVAPVSSEPTVEIPLAAVVPRLPEPLRARLTRSPEPTEVLRLPLRTTLEQLQRGAVRVSFGEIRSSAAATICAGGSEDDASLIDLPLPEVLSRVHPSHLQRRPQQKVALCPEGVPPVFTSRRGTSAQASPLTAAPPVAPSLAPSAREPLPASRPVPSVAPTPVIKLPVSPPPSRLPMTGLASQGVAEPPRGNPISIPLTPIQTPIPQRLDQSAGATEEPLKVPLVSVARNWPEPMRREVLATHLAASIAVPFVELEAAMKRGKAAFSWKQIRLWLTPKASNALTEHDAVSLELPLAVITPLFMARRLVAPSTKRAAAEHDIPDIFTARKAETAAAVPTGGIEHATLPAPATGLPLVERSVAPAASERPRPTAPTQDAGLDKLTLARSSAIPTEVVLKACQLPGVAGAILSTLDGLTIASQLPPGMKHETAAGFLPQIYTRLGQYTRELKLGDPSQVEMLVGHVPLQIIRTPAAYFAVLGKSSEPLPKLQLLALANQLSHPTH